LGVPLVAGRDLNWTDIEQIRPVVLVSENFAREYWSSPRGALGKRIHDPAGAADRVRAGVFCHGWRFFRRLAGQMRDWRFDTGWPETNQTMCPP